MVQEVPTYEDPTVATTTGQSTSGTQQQTRSDSLRASASQSFAGRATAASSTWRVKHLRKLYRFDAGKVRGSWRRLLGKCRALGWRGHLNGPLSGARSFGQQALLYARFKLGTGAPAFPPWGPSRHLKKNTRGQKHWRQAVDVSYVPSLIAIARRLGVYLHTPYAYEPWHVEAAKRFNARNLRVRR